MASKGGPAHGAQPAPLSALAERGQELSRRAEWHGLWEAGETCCVSHMWGNSDTPRFQPHSQLSSSKTLGNSQSLCASVSCPVQCWDPRFASLQERLGGWNERKHGPVKLHTGKRGTPLPLKVWSRDHLWHPGEVIGKAGSGPYPDLLTQNAHFYKPPPPGNVQAPHSWRRPEHRVMAEEARGVLGWL